MSIDFLNTIPFLFLIFFHVKIFFKNKFGKPEIIYNLAASNFMMSFLTTDIFSSKYSVNTEGENIAGCEREAESCMAVEENNSNGTSYNYSSSNFNNTSSTFSLPSFNAVCREGIDYFAFANTTFILESEKSYSPSCLTAYEGKHSYSPSCPTAYEGKHSYSPSCPTAYEGKHSYSRSCPTAYEGKHSYSPSCPTAYEGKHSYSPSCLTAYEGKHFYSPSYLTVYEGKHSYLLHFYLKPYGNKYHSLLSINENKTIFFKFNFNNYKQL